jgi:peptidase M42 family hydrolase
MSMELDQAYLKKLLLHFLGIHSPVGYTDPIVREVCKELDQLGISYELTRRGAIRATLAGETSLPARAVVAHLDTLGAMVADIKDNGRLSIVPLGTWSARFAEGARVSIFAKESIYRGTILPLKASGHVYNTEVDTQPVSWDNLEVRIDAITVNLENTRKLGIRVGDFIGVDAQAEFLANGFLVARHLDDKAGVATLLAVAKCVRERRIPLPQTAYLLFTISEEVGIGASAVLHGDISEMVSVDNGTCAPGQASTEFGATLAMADSSGPFDFHLTHHLLQLCEDFEITHARDVFRYYRCDSASAVEAGNDIRTALVAFGVDSSHGYERTHIRSLEATGSLLLAYLVSAPISAQRSCMEEGLTHFPETRIVPMDSVSPQESSRVLQQPLVPRYDQKEDPED